MSSVAPVVVTVSAPTTLKEVFSLKPGTLYTVIVKVFRFYSVECSDTRIARTGQLKVCVCVRVKDGQKHIYLQMSHFSEQTIIFKTENIIDINFITHTYIRTCTNKIQQYKSI